MQHWHFFVNRSAKSGALRLVLCTFTRWFATCSCGTNAQFLSQLSAGPQAGIKSRKLKLLTLKSWKISHTSYCVLTDAASNPQLDSGFAVTFDVSASARRALQHRKQCLTQQASRCDHCRYDNFRRPAAENRLLCSTHLLPFGGVKPSGVIKKSYIYKDENVRRFAQTKRLMQPPLTRHTGEGY